MKIGYVLALCAAAALVGGCEKKDEGGDAKADGAKTGSAESGAKAGGGTGVKECDDYFAKVESCVKDMPAEAKGAMEQAAKTMRESIEKAPNAEAKKAMATGCKSALDALASNPACK